MNDDILCEVCDEEFIHIEYDGAKLCRHCYRIQSEYDLDQMDDMSNLMGG